MPRRKTLVDINGVVATIEEHIENRGYTRAQAYSKAKRSGLTITDFLATLPEVGLGETQEPPSGDPFERGRQWDIEGCNNLINAAFEEQNKEMIDAIVFYLQNRTEKTLLRVKYHEQWFRDALPNYYNIDPEAVIKRAWRKSRAIVAAMRSGIPKNRVKKADIAEFSRKDGKTDDETRKGL